MSSTVGKPKPEDQTNGSSPPHQVDDAGDEVDDDAGEAPGAGGMVTQ